jgi:hypothetical protein
MKGMFTTSIDDLYYKSVLLMSVMSSAWSSFAGSWPAVGDNFDVFLTNDSNKHVYFVFFVYFCPTFFVFLYVYHMCRPHDLSYFVVFAAPASCSMNGRIPYFYTP